MSTEHLNPVLKYGSNWKKREKDKISCSQAGNGSFYFITQYPSITEEVIAACLGSCPAFAGGCPAVPAVPTASLS